MFARKFRRLADYLDSLPTDVGQVAALELRCAAHWLSSSALIPERTHAAAMGTRQRQTFALPVIALSAACFPCNAAHTQYVPAAGNCAPDLLSGVRILRSPCCCASILSRPAIRCS